MSVRGAVDRKAAQAYATGRGSQAEGEERPAKLACQALPDDDKAVNTVKAAKTAKNASPSRLAALRGVRA